MKNQYPAALRKNNSSFPHIVHISNVEISAAKNIFVWQVLNDYLT
jgi:hypothetical protein